MAIRKPQPVYCRHHYDLDVPFFDVDAMQIVWHGHYVKYLESARCDFLETLAYTYEHMRADGYAWPIVQMQLKYLKPATFRQRLRVHLLLREYESCLRLDYHLADHATQTLLCKASTTQAVVRLDTGDMQYLTPPQWHQALARHPGFDPAGKA